jgi:hypothetical protein
MISDRVQDMQPAIGWHDALVLKTTWGIFDTLLDWLVESFADGMLQPLDLNPWLYRPARSKKPRWRKRERADTSALA